MAVKKKWDWKDDDCLRDLGKKLIDGNNMRQTRDLLDKDYEGGVPKVAVFTTRVGQSNTSTHKDIERVLGPVEYEKLLFRLGVYRTNPQLAGVSTPSTLRTVR